MGSKNSEQPRRREKTSICDTFGENQMLMCGAGILTFLKAYCSSGHIGEVLFLLLRVASRSGMDGNLRSLF